MRLNNLSTNRTDRERDRNTDVLQVLQEIQVEQVLWKKTQKIQDVSNLLSSLLIIAFVITAILTFDAVFEMEVRLKKPGNIIPEGFYLVKGNDELKHLWSMSEIVGKGAQIWPI